MLTAHQRVLIVRHLPEVLDAAEIEFPDPIDATMTFMRLADGSSLTIRPGGKVRRCRGRDDYSDKADVLPIEPGLRRRLVRVFGPLDFGDDE